MRLLTHNMLSLNIKGVANGFPLRIEVEKAIEKQVELNASFLRNVFPKIEWKVLVDAARTMGYAQLPEEADSSMLDSDEFLNKLHHALLELHLEKGALVCPETARRFPVNQGIPNMLLHEDEDSNNGGEIQTRMTLTLIGNCGSKGFCDSVLPTAVVHAPLVCAEAGEAPAKKTEDKVETPPVSESKDKVEAGNETQEPAKEGQDEAKADKPDAAPSLEDKVDQPDAAPSSEDKSGALHDDTST